ncbi:glycosyltransferase family 2 protein [Halogranum rubrum]|uniref:glycosyltransferase family 2 protein n=1 Tax=Halogranum rubrum TaxID=553466 RepID=UPI000A0318F1|nr:glycosyltransferase family 2 protein [Halogranum salarium]
MPDVDTKVPHVGIVVLNWNGYDDTKSCLKSLSMVEYPNFDIVVVDNNSTDRSVDKLRSEFPGQTVIENSSNIGFAAGCNVGISHFQKKNSDYVLLLNNDATVDKKSLGRLVSTIERGHKVAAVSGVIYEKETGEVWSAGHKLIPWMAKFRPETNIKSETVYETEFLTGAALLLNLEAIKELGKLDESFFFGFEDQEFSLRARKEGWRLLVNPTAEIFHIGGSTSGEGSEFKFYHATRNRLLFAKRLPGLQRVLFYSFFMISRIGRLIQWRVLNPQYSDRARGIVQGIYDHIRGSQLKKPGHFGLGPDKSKK